MSSVQKTSLPAARLLSLPVVQRLRGAWRAVEGPLLAVLGALLIGGLLILLTGHDPLEAYWEMLLGAVAGQRFVHLAATLTRAVPIIGMGLAAAVAFRAGFFNLGGEGQLVLGALAGALVALYLPLPAPLRLPAVIAGAMLVGGLLAWLPTWAQFRFGVPLLISSLLLNYPARFLASYVVVYLVRDVPSGMSQTHLIPEAVRLPLLMRGTQLHAGLFITLAVVLATAFFMQRSVPGYELRMAGLNPDFARYGGIHPRRLGYRVMFASGALAGLVGAIEVLGVNYRFIDNALTSPQYAWVGLMAALLSGSSPLGVLIAGLFFSAIVTGGASMERATDVPRELSRILQAVIILFVAARERFRLGGQARETG